MTLRTPVRFARPLVLAVLCVAAAHGQQTIGYVSTTDAEVTGSTDTIDGRAVLAGSVSVTAKDHTAPIALSRGGTVNVCQTSALHVTESGAMGVAAPLLFSLDRGAIEIQMTATATDAVMTPDLRLTVRNRGLLDLRLRVARNGDTCVENRGAAAPTLAVSDPFGDSMYELRAGQHVLFEHGSLHEVVDSESSPCGCPDAKGMSMADALIAHGSGTSPKPAAAAPTPPVAPVVPPTPAAETHPFPMAISAGLAAPAEVPQAQPGEVHTQITGALSYSPGLEDPDVLDSSRPAQPTLPPPVAPQPVAPPPVQAVQAGAPPAVQLGVRPAALPQPAAAAPASGTVTPAPSNHGLAHAVGHFFKKLFGG
jgi:hypothetical protein